MRWGKSRKSLEPSRDYFLKKGLRELPLIEKTYTNLDAEGKTEEAAELLTNYTRDFFGATVLKWDELKKQYWKDNWSGF